MANVAQDQLEVLRLVTTRLEAAGIAYMVTGSVAAAFYTQPRMTRDIDLVVELNDAAVPAVVDLFAADFLLDADSLRNAVRQGSMCNLIHTEAIVKVDLMMRKPTPYRHEEFQRRRRGQIDGVAVWLVALEDLILSKLVWAGAAHSELQWRDIRALLHSGASLDAVYLETWARELGIYNQLQEAQTP